MSRKMSFKEFIEVSAHLSAIAEAETIDRKPDLKNNEVPLHVPGGATVVVLNDNVTPFEVVIEAIMHATHLSQSEATKRMLAAHKNGWAAVASYPSRDMAETVASNIEEHAAHNPNYDHYRQVSGHHGPWPLTCEVMDADQT